MDIDTIITAVNALADAKRGAGSSTAWLALVHRSNQSPAAEHARAIRLAGNDALDLVADWEVVDRLNATEALLAAPDGTRVSSRRDWDGLRLTRLDPETA